MDVIRIRTQESGGPALWATGFRPFFLLAGAWSTLLVVLWGGFLAGVLPLPAWNPVAWHGHEMLFGYTSAVIAGFLLTAARNWTQLPTASGRALQGLAALWLAGRVLLLAGTAVPPALALAVDVAFFPALALVVARPVVRSRNWRNLAFVPMLLGLAALNLFWHLRPELSSRLLWTATGIVVLMMTLVGGRIIPFFTRNALEVPARPLRWADWSALFLTLAVVLLDAAAWAEPVPWIAGAAALFHLIRMLGWQSLATARTPILWVLHLGYLWIPIGFLLRALPLSIPPTAALHAFTAGAIGMLTLGMMTRVSLGHTGRNIAADGGTAVAFLLVLLAAALRVAGPIAAPAFANTWHLSAAAAWTVAFAWFVMRYAGILVTPRPDGRPG